MTLTQINAPYLYNYTFPDKVINELGRNIIIETIERLLIEEQGNVVFIEGKSGSGKTILLSQFIKKQYKNSISYFVSSIDKYTHSKESLNSNLFNQLNFYLGYDEAEYDKVPDNFIYQLRQDLDRKIRKLGKGEYLFIVLDGLEHLNNKGLQLFKELITDFPWSKAKFIFSGDADRLRVILPEKLKIKSYPISFFSTEEIEEYFSNFQLSKEQIRDIHLLSERGLPEKLSRIRSNFAEKDIESVLEELNEDKVSLFEMDWQKVNSDLQRKIIAILAFSDPFYIISALGEILETTDLQIKKAIENISFLSIKGNTVSFNNQEYLEFAKDKMKSVEKETQSDLINFFIKNDTTNEDGRLSNLYIKAKRWQDLLRYLSFETFLKLIEKSKSFDAINDQLNIGLKASKDSNNSYSDYLRFALPKSSFKEIEKIDGLENEIKARISLGDTDGALALLDNTFLKEDRLKLLAHLAKQQKINKIDVAPSVINEIHSLYKSINIGVLEDGALKLATTLLYSCPDLAIDIVEKTSENSDGSKRDKLYAFLSVSAMTANRKSDSNLADISSIQKNISSGEERDLVQALSHLGEEFSAQEILEKSKALETPSRVIYLLKNWIKFNQKDDKVLEVIDEVLNQVIKGSIEETPNAIVLMNLAQPLPFVTDYVKLKEVISIFDTQKTVITTPTRDYIKLQLLLAEAESKFDLPESTLRLIDIYFYIGKIEDLAIKNDCLVLLWLKLKTIDTDNEIEVKEGLGALAKQDADELLNNLIGETAMHFEVLEYIISYSVEYDLEFVTSILKRLNTQLRRDYANRLAVQKYTEAIKANEANIDFLFNCYYTITDESIKEDTLTVVFQYLYFSKVPEVMSHLPRLIEDVKKMKNSEARCYNLCLAIKGFDQINKSNFTKELLLLLKTSWKEIDTLWIKVDVATKIAVEIAEFSHDIAEEYLEEGLQVKCDSVFESYSSASAYFLSLNLCIRAFSGLIKPGQNYEEDLNTLRDLIDIIPCSGERIRLYSKLAMKFYQKRDESMFKEIMKRFVLHCLSELSNSKDISYFIFIFKSISPALYLYHQHTFKLYIDRLPLFEKEVVLMDCLIFLLKDIYVDEHYDVGDFRNILTYERAIDSIELLKNMEYDNSIYVAIREIVESLDKSKEISYNQKTKFVKEIRELVDQKLPNAKTGVEHEGYKFACYIYLDSLSTARDKTYTENFVSKILTIKNTSDRSLLLHLLSKKINFKSNHQKLDVLLKAFHEAKKIPSRYDMIIRNEEMLPTLAQTDRKEFAIKMNELISTIVSDKEDEDIYSKHRSLIDILHQYDPKNIGNYIDVLDKDPARNKGITQSVKNRLDTLERNSSYKDDIARAKKFESANEMSEFSFNLLSKVQTGRYTSKQPEETFSLLESASNFNLSESYSTYCYCIENAVKKYENGTKNQDFLRGIYDSTIFNAKLISTLTQSSIQSMRNRYSIINRSKSKEKSFFRIGERELAINYLRNWLENVKENHIILIDSYFKFQDVEFLQIVKEVNPSLEISILTSKEGLSGVSYEEAYMDEWTKISHEKPPHTNIKIVWIDGSDKTPFHDRYLIAGSYDGLRLGSSFGSIASSKDAEISVMANNQILELEDTIIRDYVHGGKSFFNEKRLKHKAFTL
ncbi:ATP-binding protein [Pedobacter agri]|uniref:ATP-binding protein n=1 Tax=Pedobacter agri TaxID=454586 RepID=UPI002931DD95|nr:ATP-binding protein [Pedobacter agri]